MKKQEKKFNERVRKLSLEKEEQAKKMQDEAFQRDLDLAHGKQDKNGEYNVKLRVSCNFR